LVALTTGSRIGPYEITSPLGEGGMGVVYRAHDTKLGRDVAIKALPDAFATDADRLQRFQREAQVLASLNHSNIAQIYGLEESDKTRCIVMELVEGQTLQERLRRGPIPLDEALPMASQIATALEAAHERGIIHRDLKPANIKLTPDGGVKVLDFGLARMRQAEGDPTNLSNSPTLMSAASTPGMIMGTAAYMSPEQAKGRPVDGRTDIFAFGTVLYEMLTGRPAFEGEDVPDILSRILQREPDWTLLPASVPPRIRELLRLCLEKTAKNRRQSAGDVRIDIKQALATVGTVPDRPTVSARSALAWAVATVTALGLSLIAILYFREKPPTEPPEMRLEITTPSTAAPLEFALSPDGRYIVFVASGSGPQQLWLRALDKTEARPLAGTEAADYPFWSADSRSIGFTAAGKIKRIDIAGGSPVVLANTSAIRSGTWNSDGTILFNAVYGPVSRIAASGGGQPVAVTPFDPQRQPSHMDPRFLPDGRHFLFYSFGTPEVSGIYLASLDGGEPKRLTAADTAGAYLAPGMIVYVRQTTLMAQHLDLKRGELTEDPIKVADNVSSSFPGFGGFSVSADGRLAYRPGGGELRQLKWYDRTGRPVGVAGEPDSTQLLYPELSPDGGRVALNRSVQNNTDVWLRDLVRGGMTRFTLDPAIDGSPLWSPDGKRIAFLSSRKGPYNLYLRPSSGIGPEELLLETPNNKFPQDWSKDGQFLLYSEADPKTGRDLWALPMTGNDRKPIVVVKTAFDELNGQFSPDGRWIAYETNESGRFEIVVQPFPVPSGKYPVSTGGGVQPRWRADSKELYFIAPDGKLMATSVTSTGATFAAGTPMALFLVAVAPGAGTNKQQYAVSRDGRFLINQPVEASSTTPITLILNWKPKP
jgi:serine/threonine protein kinase/Tol biopolymer transport system component